jgi:hypothetical protein
MLLAQSSRGAMSLAPPPEPQLAFVLGVPVEDELFLKDQGRLQAVDFVPGDLLAHLAHLILCRPRVSPPLHEHQNDATDFLPLGRLRRLKGNFVARHQMAEAVVYDLSSVLPGWCVIDVVGRLTGEFVPAAAGPGHLRICNLDEDYMPVLIEEEGEKGDFLIDPRDL